MVSRNRAPRRSMKRACWSLPRGWSLIPLRARKSLVLAEATMPDSQSVINSFIGPWMLTQAVSIALIRVSSSLFGTTTAACHRVHRSIMWKIMFLWTNNRSHSTCWLNLSDISTLQAVLGPGFVHSRHTRHVLTISGIRSRTRSATPTRCRKRFMVCSEACHHRTCSLRSESRIADSLLVLKMRTTRPMSKSLQLYGCSGLSP